MKIKNMKIKNKTTEYTGTIIATLKKREEDLVKEYVSNDSNYRFFTKLILEGKEKGDNILSQQTNSLKQKTYIKIQMEIVSQIIKEVEDGKYEEL
jgi:hypothetical protein